MPISSDSSSPSEPSSAPRRTLGSRAAGLAGYIENLPRGQRAQLRRVSFAGQPPAIFWQMARHPELGFPSEEEAFWLEVLPLMANQPHTPARPFGRRLAEGRVSFSRIERWMRYPQERALPELRKLLDRIDGGVDWASLAEALWHWQRRPDLLRAIARDYYRALPEETERPSGLGNLSAMST